MKCDSCQSLISITRWKHPERSNSFPLWFFWASASRPKGSRPNPMHWSVIWFSIWRIALCHLPTGKNVDVTLTNAGSLVVTLPGAHRLLLPCRGTPGMPCSPRVTWSWDKLRLRFSSSRLSFTGTIPFSLLDSAFQRMMPYDAQNLPTWSHIVNFCCTFELCCRLIARTFDGQRSGAAAESITYLPLPARSWLLP